MKKLTAILVSGLLATSFAYAAEGEEAKMQSEQTFAAIDANQDGVIDTEEARADSALMEKWASVDLDGDGAISSQEYSVYAGEATAAGE
ncbi:hypothetical protein [Hahella ganghwensis]|uniref:hypothetical protein n=1 Tax=Hahella ganghwensis TaxID=286420 RepID=UPI00037F61FE|nr:hypothetical protein [Hahella ganghwensis]